jgi:hypothetical protein
LLKAQPLWLQKSNIITKNFRKDALPSCKSNAISILQFASLFQQKLSPYDPFFGISKRAQNSSRTLYALLAFAKISCCFGFIGCRDGKFDSVLCQHSGQSCLPLRDTCCMTTAHFYRHIFKFSGCTFSTCSAKSHGSVLRRGSTHIQSRQFSKDDFKNNIK